PDDCNFYVSVQLTNGWGEPLTLPVRTAYRDGRVRLTWNEWLILPIKYRDIPRDASLVFSVWGVQDDMRPDPLSSQADPRKPSASTTLPLFTHHSVFRRGSQKLRLWPNEVPDGSISSTTPGKSLMKNGMDMIEKLVKKHDSGEVARVDWLDNLAFREIGREHQKASSRSKESYLYIELQKFDFTVVHSESIAGNRSDHPMMRVYDPDQEMENPVEAKHRRLVRSHRAGHLDRELKPNARIRDDLQAILRYPPTQALGSEEKDLLWKFRFYLTRDKKALTKYLKCVVWTDPNDARQAVELLPEWEHPDVDDALELLGPFFRHREVRAYAVAQLERAGDEELQLYLLQLVQALKFEGMTTSPSSLSFTPRSTQHSSSILADFLIRRSITNPTLGNYFYWYLKVECEDPLSGGTYTKVIQQYLTALERVHPDRKDVFKRQGRLVHWLGRTAKELQLSKDTRPRKEEIFRQRITDPARQMTNFEELPLPMDPKIRVTGIVPEQSRIFKSSQSPLNVAFSCANGRLYRTIFKAGDDLRQDQLIIQMITLMDMLLRKENLDLKLTPYKVLATGPEQGLVQMIPSASLAEILSVHEGGLLAYFRKFNPDPSSMDSYGVSPSVMDNYVKSCAGYCVITYLLGVGDRHLDNLLITQEGHLFHIDFGFILGRDPKPFPPPMKV
ncbi:kinase-like domain-containing protein, partial [Piptocephalis cylindrospora]